MYPPHFVKSSDVDSSGYRHICWKFLAHVINESVDGIELPPVGLLEDAIIIQCYIEEVREE